MIFSHREDMLEKSIRLSVGEEDMIIEREFTVIKPEPSLGEMAKILDEMDRLLNEMKDTMRVIKSIMDEEVEGKTPISFLDDLKDSSPSEYLIHSS